MVKMVVSFQSSHDSSENLLSISVQHRYRYKRKEKCFYQCALNLLEQELGDKLVPKFSFFVIDLQLLIVIVGSICLYCFL